MKISFVILSILIKFSTNSQISIRNLNFTRFNEVLRINNNNRITFATSSVKYTNYCTIFQNPNPHIIYDFNKQSIHYGNQSNRLDYNYFIIIDENLTNFNDTIYKLFEINNLNVHGKYLIIIEEFLNHNTIAETFEYLFKQFDIYNVIVMNNNEFFTWHLYDERCNTNITIHQIQIKDLLENFNNKIPTNFNKCEIHINVPLRVPLPGHLILHLLAKHVNATVIQMNQERSIHWNILLKTYGHCRDLDSNMRKLNVLVNSYTGTTETFDLQYSTYVANDFYTALFIPPRRTIPKWKEFKVFSNELILATVIAIVLCILSYSLLTQQSLMESSFRIYQLCLQLSLNRLPKKWTLRIYSMFLFFFVMEISAAYLSGLSGVFTRPSLEPKITTIQEAFDSDIQIKTESAGIQILRSMAVENKRKPWRKSKFVIKEIDNNWYDKAQLLCDLKHYITCGVVSDRARRYNKIGIVPISHKYPYFMCYRKRMHLNRLINYHIRNAQETGIAKFNQSAPLMSDKYFKDVEQVIVLNVNDLYGIFIIWLFGIGIATVAFVFEIISYKREQRITQLQKLYI